MAPSSKSERGGAGAKRGPAGAGAGAGAGGGSSAAAGRGRRDHVVRQLDRVKVGGGALGEGLQGGGSQCGGGALSRGQYSVWGRGVGSFLGGGAVGGIPERNPLALLPEGGLS